MLDLIDTHCHIQSAGELKGEAHTRQLWQKLGLSGQEIVDYAAKSQVKGLICVGCDLEDSLLASEFAARAAGRWSAVGVHPHEAKRYVSLENFKAELVKLAQLPNIVAIGECGLDYHYLHSLKADQKALLKKQLEVASQLNLPVIFHVREALHDFWPIFDTFRSLKGVLHSYSDDLANLEKAQERGLFIGVNGIATFNKSPELKEVYKKVPLEALLLETDAPYLAPVPYRGKVNQPAYVLSVAQYLAELKEVSVDEVAEQTTANAKALFRL